MRSVGVSLARALHVSSERMFPATLVFNCIVKISITFIINRAFSEMPMFPTETDGLVLYFIIPYFAVGVLEFALGDELKTWAEVIFISLL